MALDPKLFDSISNITSVDQLPDLEFIWKQYDAQASGAAGRLTPQQNRGAATTLSKAAANCLRLVLEQQQQPAAGIDTKPWTMPTQPSTVTAVRMVLHVFARFASDWIFSLMAANNSSGYCQARTGLETAVQQAGGVIFMLLDWQQGHAWCSQKPSVPVYMQFHFCHWVLHYMQLQHRNACSCSTAHFASWAH